MESTTYSHSTPACLSGSEVLDLLKPSVYAWCRAGKWLYVGKSRLGVTRLGGHHVITRERIEATDEILIWRFNECDEVQLLAFEAQLIEAHKPSYNSAPADRRYLPGGLLNPYPKPKKKRVYRPTRSKEPSKGRYTPKRAEARFPILRSTVIQNARGHAASYLKTPSW